MKSVMIVSLLTLLRLGVPALILLLVGEAVRHSSGGTQKARGAK
jgi:hypothetical protein